MTTVRAVRAATVDHSLGVQVDLSFGNWSSIPSLISEAQYVGADTVRVAAPTSGNWTVQAGYNDQLVAAGLKLDVVVDTAETPAANVAAIARFVQAHPGSVALVEGPNEPNNWGVSYAGQTGVAGALAWQQDFYAAMKANPLTAGISVAGMSSWPYIAAASDVNNLHVYPNSGDQPLAALQTTLSQQAAVDPGKPFAITEMGWYTLPGVGAAGTNWAGVDEASQAKLVLNAYMDAASLGATNIGLYALRDWAGTDIGAHFGLFRNNDTPKAAATALHNLQAILADNSPAAASFTPATLDLTTNAPADVHTLLLQKAAGDFVLALWREPDLWNETTGAAINAAPVRVQLSTRSARTVSIHDPVMSATPIEWSTSAQLTVTVIDHPIYVLWNSNSKLDSAKVGTR